MIGNDIVDKAYISKQTNWKRPGFVSKVFTTSEQNTIFCSQDQDLLVWRLWSMKEAAYKAYISTFGVRFFNPKTCECQVISETLGKVIIQGKTYNTYTIYNRDYIHSTTYNTNVNEVKFKIFEVTNNHYNCQSTILKQKLLTDLSEERNEKQNLLDIRKSEVGIPKVYLKNVQLPIQISLTHCGHYVAYSVLDA